MAKSRSRLFAAIMVIAALTVAVVHAGPDRASAAPTQAQWMALAVKTLREEPYDRRIFDTMKKNFPKELDAILQGYIVEAKNTVTEVPPHLPRFPYRQVQGFLPPEVMVAAPDAELSALAKALAVYARGYRAIPLSCSSLATGGGLILEAPIHEDVTPREFEANADLLVASIHAVRAGLDRPTKRPASKPILDTLILSFATRFSGMLDLSAKNPVRALPEARRCDFLIAYYAWVADLPPDQAAYLLTHARKLTKAEAYKQDDSPFKLLPVMVLRANTQN